MFIWSFFSLDRWAEKMWFCIEFLLSFQTIYLRPIRFEFQIALKWLIVWKNSAQFACPKFKIQLWCRGKNFQTDMTGWHLFSWNMISREILGWRGWKNRCRQPLKLLFLTRYGLDGRGLNGNFNWLTILRETHRLLDGMAGVKISCKKEWNYYLQYWINLY